MFHERTFSFLRDGSNRGDGSRAGSIGRPERPEMSVTRRLGVGQLTDAPPIIKALLERPFVPKFCYQLPNNSRSTS